MKNCLLKLSLLTILGLLSVLSAKAYTAIGCVSNYSGWLYTNNSGAYSPSGSPNSGAIAYETSPQIKDGLGEGIYCSPTSIRPCVIRTTSTCTGCTANRYKYSNGTRYYEQPGMETGYYQCPIDDYAGLLVVLVGGIGFFVLRKAF